jgi:drug/metabolite transporter (DMT)-like permease
MSTWPVMCALLAWPALGEQLGVWSVVGIGLTVAGVLTVLYDRKGKARWAPKLSGRSRSWAIVFGLLGALGQASGLVLAKLGMAAVGDGAQTVDPLSATLVRMLAGGVGIWVIAAVAGLVPASVRSLKDRPAVWATFIGSVLGPTFGVWMSLVAAANTSAGVAATLMATMPILALPMARIAYGSRPGPGALAGTAVAFVGVAILFLMGN